MRRLHHYIVRGQSLFEIVIALALFLIAVSGIGMVLYGNFETANTSLSRAQAAAKLQESIQAVRSIGGSDWSQVIDGTYGLSYAGGAWSLTPSPDTDGVYTRQVTVSSVERDVGCNIVASGTQDPDTKFISATVSWQQALEAVSSTIQTYVPRFDDPTFCIAADDSESLVLDVSVARLDYTKKSLQEITVENIGDEAVTIDTMTLSWTRPGNIIYIKIDGENHWHYTNGVGSPQGAQPSGTELDLVNFTLQPEETFDVDPFRFDSKMSGAVFTITVTMTDGSSVTEVATPNSDDDD